MAKARLVSNEPSRRFGEAEWRARVELAACYRLAEMNRLGKVIWNHITARVLDEPDCLLVFRLGCRYDEVTASNLVKMRLDGTMLTDASEARNTAAYVIHGAIFKARPDVNCVMRTHSRGGQGVAALKDGLLPLSQEAMKFYEALAYHEYEGISDDESEMDRLAASLGAMNQMVLRNHGLLTVGKTVGEAYWRMFDLELACALQMDVLATGREVVMPRPEICRKVRDTNERDFTPGKYEWPALLRHLDKVAPDYRT